MKTIVAVAALAFVLVPFVSGASAQETPVAGRKVIKTYSAVEAMGIAQTETRDDLRSESRDYLGNVRFTELKRQRSHKVVDDAKYPDCAWIVMNVDYCIRVAGADAVCSNVQDTEYQCEDHR